MTQLLWNCCLQWHTSGGNRTICFTLEQFMASWPQTLSCKFDFSQVDDVTSSNTNFSKPSALSHGLDWHSSFLKKAFAYHVLYISNVIGMHKPDFSSATHSTNTALTKSSAHFLRYMCCIKSFGLLRNSLCPTRAQEWGILEQPQNHLFKTGPGVRGIHTASDSGTQKSFVP